ERGCDADEAPGQVQIVGVQQTEHVAAGDPHALVERLGKPAVRLAHERDRAARFERLQDVESPVRRLAVDHDVLESGIPLCRHALEAAFDGRPRVQAWRDDADRRNRIAASLVAGRSQATGAGWRLETWS